jgi:signal transduction histidine kinase
MTQQRRARSRGKSQPAGDDLITGAGTVASDVLADATMSTTTEAIESAMPDVASNSPTRRRATNTPTRAREINVTGLAERAREPLAPPPLPLRDALAQALPRLRQALLDRPFSEAARIVAEGIAATFSPARAEIWIAEPAALHKPAARTGGQELAPTLRCWATATVSPDEETAATHGDREAAAHFVATQPGPLVAEVIATRRPVILHSASSIPATAAAPMPDDTPDTPDTPDSAALALPLHARGQFLGVLTAETDHHLGAQYLAALAEIADLTALAADRDQLLSYSRGQEALAQTVVRHAPVAIAVLNAPEYTFALANPTFSRLLGHESGQALAGKRLVDVVPERAVQLAASLRLDAALHEGEHQAMVELPLHSVEGELTYWNVTSSPLAGRGPGVSGVLVAAVDVTRQVLARQRAQDVAEVAQERIGQMMALHATSLEVASQLGADSRDLVADILRRSIVLLGARAGAVYVRAERLDELHVIVSQGLRGDYTGSRIHIGEGLAGQVALTGQGLVVDDYRTAPLRVPIYEGEDFRAVIAVPLRQHNRVIGVLEVLDDAERRVFTTDDLWLLELFAAQAAQAIENARTYVELDRAYHKQRALDRLKDDFIATASHELRTPLTGVQGFLDLLHDYPGSRDEPRALDFLERAIESAQELADIAERLLQTSRLDSGRVEVHIGPLRLAPVVEEVLRAYRLLREAQGSGHALTSEIAGDLSVYADLGRLKEVLDNLIGNAVKYSPRGGQVTVTCELAAFGRPDADAAGGLLAAADEALSERPTLVLPHLEEGDAADEAPDAPHAELRAAAAHQPYVVITVSDDGIGIPPEEREGLFGRFSRGDSARTSEIRGTGLGLYICRQIARAMGGDVWLHTSVPGAGSTFALALPAAPALTTDPASADSSGSFVLSPGVSSANAR